jgi:hypothetical protein
MNTFTEFKDYINELAFHCDSPSILKIKATEIAYRDFEHMLALCLNYLEFYL